MTSNQSYMRFISKLLKKPDAMARIAGSSEYPNISGRVFFYQTGRGVLVSAEIFGLPAQNEFSKNGIFAFHIHTGTSCAGNQSEAFPKALGHYNPANTPHPYHAGDMPPLFGNNGYAFQVFLTDRFSVREITNRTVIIHSMPDDFTTQPAGNAGEKIACGKIYAL